MQPDVIEFTCFTLGKTDSTHPPSVCLDQISRLPLELSEMILDEIFKAVFVPGEVVPSWHTSHINEDCFLDQNEDFWYKYALRALDNKLYERYKHRYWSDNTWVSQK